MLSLSFFKDIDPKIKKIFDEVSFYCSNLRNKPLTIDESHQRIGIGTVSPTKELEVAGDVKVSGLTETKNLFVPGSILATNIDVVGPVSAKRLFIESGLTVGNDILLGSGQPFKGITYETFTWDPGSLNNLAETQTDLTIPSGRIPIGVKLPLAAVANYYFNWGGVVGTDHNFQFASSTTTYVRIKAYNETGGVYNHAPVTIRVWELIE